MLHYQPVGKELRTETATAEAAFHKQDQPAFFDVQKKIVEPLENTVFDYNAFTEDQNGVAGEYLQRVFNGYVAFQIQKKAADGGWEDTCLYRQEEDGTYTEITACLLYTSRCV